MRTGDVVVETECGACKGTGVYRAFVEKGIGVVCYCCKGNGKSSISYTPFTGKKTWDDIHTVYARADRYTTFSGPGGEAVSYTDFLSGSIPTGTK